MKKFLFGGVSMLAIIATTNANAAGYTCENLVEYTSCNGGYTLSVGECVEIPTCSAGTYAKYQCPSGYNLLFGVCIDGNNGYTDEQMFSDDCDGAYYEFACGNGSDYAKPVEYTCASCPSTGLVDPSDNPILATTNTGATSVAECYVKPGIDIKGEYGTYHFKSNCISVNPGSIKTAADCEWLTAATGEDWAFGDYGDGFTFCEYYPRGEDISTVVAPKTESECLAINDLEYHKNSTPEDTTFINGVCSCQGGMWFFDFEDGKLRCGV